MQGKGGIKMKETSNASHGPIPNHTPGELNTPASNPLCGVRGWLKFVVVMNLYISPALFALQYIMAWIGASTIAANYPGFTTILMIETIAGGFFIWKFIKIARHLRDIKPGVVQEMKKWLKLYLGWVIIDTPLILMSGMKTEDLMPATIKGLVLGLIRFAIWYSYFNVSKRVKATYSDWDQ